jgi:DNA-binding NarL/FixJ family response regulator
MIRATRVVIGEDDVLLREGIVRLLEDRGLDVVAQAGDADDLMRKALAHSPDVVIADIQMPPDQRDDGLRAAIEIRRRRPATGVLVMSQTYDERYIHELIGERAEGVGYLLKERVSDVDNFVEAVGRVANGGTAVDSAIVASMLGNRPQQRPLEDLSPRELEVLRAMAEGRSNRGIASALLISVAVVEKDAASIFRKLALDPSSDESRRVMAVLAYLRDGALQH